jgi:nickel-dependent lactate racemase
MHPAEKTEELMHRYAELKYGKRKISFTLPDHADIYTVRDPEINITAGKFRIRLEKELENGKWENPDSIVIAVADKTRRCGYPEYLPVLTEVLTDFGVKASRITFHIAYGTHAPQNDKESRAVYGKCYDIFPFVHHDCRKKESFVFLGKTGRGTPVMLPRKIYEAGFLITFGAVSHHYFAGYGGGRKLIFPGLGFREAVYRNHGLFLDRKNRKTETFCHPGMLDGNPLAEDLAEYETYRPTDLAVHGIADSRGNICDLLVGRGASHFRSACRLHGENSEIRTEPSYDTVLASCGGHPKDINMIQSHKALHNAAAFMKDGGSLIILAACRDGIGSRTFLPWFDMGSYSAAFDRLAENYEGNGGTALAMMEKTQRIRIFMMTELPADIAEKMGVKKITEEDVRKKIRESSKSLAVLPHAALSVRQYS